MIRVCSQALWLTCITLRTCHHPFLSPVNNFIYFSENSPAEEKSQHLLKEQITVDFMGTEWLLCTPFQWLLNPDTVKVHLSQTRFAAHLVEENNAHLWNMTPPTPLLILGSCLSPKNCLPAPSLSACPFAVCPPCPSTK